MLSSFFIFTSCLSKSRIVLDPLQRLDQRGLTRNEADTGVALTTDGGDDVRDEETEIFYRSGGATTDGKSGVDRTQRDREQSSTIRNVPRVVSIPSIKALRPIIPAGFRIN